MMRRQDSAALDPTIATRLRERMRGPVLPPGDSDYDAARSMWNARFDHRPGAIARCTGADDVQSAVRLAQEHNLLLSVRSGGHDYAGYSVCQGGLVIDLSEMRELHVDARARTARVQPGVTWGMFDRKAQRSGLATPGPTVSSVGVAGSTLGGGTGYLSRKYGLSLDNLIAATVVTASGDIRRASETDNADLFWALRGGGGNFGVVTEFEFRLHEVGPEVLAGQVVYPFSQARDIFRFYRDFMATAPDDLQCYGVVFRVPPAAPFPAELHGETAIVLVVAFMGALTDGDTALEQLRACGRPVLSAIGPQPYTAVQQMFDPGTPKGHRWYSKAHYLGAISDPAIDALIEHARPLPGQFTIVYFDPLGGAIGRVGPSATAFANRDAACSFHILAGWSNREEDDAVMAWTRQLHDAIAPHANGGVYANLLDRDEQQRVRLAHGQNYERLAQIKATYDPGNLFRMNHNIPPAR